MERLACWILKFWFTMVFLWDVISGRKKRREEARLRASIENMPVVSNELERLALLAANEYYAYLNLINNAYAMNTRGAPSRVKDEEVVMGMFDTVWFNCPECGHREDIQSKARGNYCELAVWPLYDAPPEVQTDVKGDYRCFACGSELTVFVQTVVNVVSRGGG